MQKAFGNKKILFIFLLPAFLIYSALVIVSIIWAGYYSLFDWSGVGEKVFVGFKNYVLLLSQDKVFIQTIIHTLIYTVINVMIQVFGGLLFAILLTRITKGRTLLQTLYYIPVVISSVAICQIFSKLFSVTPTGVVNQLLSLVFPNLLHVEWLSDAGKSLYVTAFVEAYKYLGLYMVIFYAALIGVPNELGEAALVDGATILQEYLFIKIPYIKPVIIANCILVLNGSLRSFEFSYLLTHGGPGNSSELMTTYMYKQAFTSMKYGYGSSVAIMIVVLCVAVGICFRKLSGEDKYDEA
jgi:raffinose/stachyose/melibiose transport system permease protein